MAALVCLSSLVACSNHSSPTDVAKATTDARQAIQVGGPRLGGQVVSALAQAYNERDEAKLAGLLSNEPGASYLFFGTDDSWDKTEEDRIASRMFHPEDVPPGDPPVPRRSVALDIGRRVQAADRVG
jgi:hypothetical protein